MQNYAFQRLRMYYQWKIPIRLKELRESKTTGETFMIAISYSVSYVCQVHWEHETLWRGNFFQSISVENIKRKQLLWSQLSPTTWLRPMQAGLIFWELLLWNCIGGWRLRLLGRIPLGSLYFTFIWVKMSEPLGSSLLKRRKLKTKRKTKNKQEKNKIKTKRKRCNC